MIYDELKGVGDVVVVYFLALFIILLEELKGKLSISAIMLLNI